MSSPQIGASPHRPSVSIVINTLDRASSLQATLESFRWLRYTGAFEVIVVNGPSTDHSEQVIEQWSGSIRTARCPVANLSVSRNIGICMARGQIVAFIDDDAIPEPEWLDQLASAYDNPMVGAAGGFVFDHTGYSFQYRYCLVDRFGNADLTPSGATPDLCFPKSYRFPHLLGANSSFRTQALLEIGGFDEEYEYFLDETDVCLRIVDAGYLIAQLPNAYVHHKFASSNLRGVNRVVRNRYPIIKNKVYFSLKHGREFHSMDRVLKEQADFVQRQRDEMTWAASDGLISQSEHEAFQNDIDLALTVGLQRGLEGAKPDMMLTAAKRLQWAGDFHRFHPLRETDSSTLVLISKDFPPGHSGGIATFTKDLAEAYAARGNTVHVITQSSDINRVDFENGVWIHRLVPRQMERPPAAVTLRLPQHIWNWSAVAHEETARIASHRRVDVVEAPIWDCEGIAFLLDRRWALTTSLQTTLHFWLESHPERRNDADWMTAFGTPMLRAERALMIGSDAVRSISNAIRCDIEAAYDMRFRPETLRVLPLGLLSETHSAEAPTDGVCTVLFVGRLEHRKGIDVLLQAIPRVLERAPDVRFRILGDNTITDPHGYNPSQEFEKSDEGRRWKGKVVFEGRVTDEQLRTAYAGCHIFVAPSRFESFGLVFLEAMREAKPVIGCAVGGMPEIIRHQQTGLLVKPGNADELIAALLELIRSPESRDRLGKAGRHVFEERFTAARMAEGSVELYRLAQANFRKPSE
ncbi:glycosyltransferase [Variovorax ureilyticus]|uniref:Glycosyltransferase n=1 Tax=Variovorax ureilyticus TaxID=1836198 RepID=A0ABU8VIV2_9BURK